MTDFRGHLSPGSEELKGRGKPSKRLILTGTNKGGTGRTFFLLLLWDWFVTKKISVAAADCDWHSASLSRFLENAFFFDLSRPDAVDQMVELFARNDVVILDGPGIQHPRYWEWMRQSGVYDLVERIDAGITVALTIEEDKDTVFQAAQAAEAVGAGADWIVIQNLKTSEATSIYENSSTRLHLLKMGAQHLVLERLPWASLARMQRTSQTISALIDDPEVPILEKQRLKGYRTKTFKEFDLASKLLLPELATRYQSIGGQAGGDSVRPRIAPAEV